MTRKREVYTLVERFYSARNILDREESVLMVIDVQDKLMPVINNGEKVINNIVRLLKFSKIIDLPVILTEQEKLGATVPEIRNEMSEVNPIIKKSFSCFLCDEFEEIIRRIARKKLILTGVETHICITQTALHALQDFEVHVVSDAVSSRTIENFNTGIERIRHAGAVITSTEMVIFELLRRAGTEEFKAALQLVK